MHPRELSIQTPHLTFAALEWGDPQGNPVIALHGWLDNAASFTPMATKLEGIRLIVPDQAGHGLSEHRAEWFSYDVWHYVEDLVYIAESLQLERFGLLGHSMGGVVSAMAAGSVLKEQVTGLVAIDGLFPWPRKPEDAPKALMDYINQRRTPAAQLPVARYRSKQQAVRARAMSQFKVSRLSSELLVDRSITRDGEDWVWTSDPRLKLGSPTRFSLEQTLAFPRQIICPAHMIYVDSGPISDAIDEYRGQLTNIQFHAMSGSHHLHMDDQVDSIADIVNSVLGGGL
ncbi:alpha/beta fold hydrolase [Endozoicomonas sp. SCSIO W0465]|uniref:alpha/beta fold hydrolase n=1 Tax=Endozoicomonas sp. SCSIO W0465 TaxID=2918516 RepID=UPI002075212E|nr:alpha/beta fold hydrolase [Endozoicomonas sp. SCSIO W0465]USE39177.1 alpha/beta hydrolase [Endozoicomonas sp. SCSIO W0465]